MHVNKQTKIRKAYGFFFIQISFTYQQKFKSLEPVNIKTFKN